jgi:hypothetical protein
MLFFALVYFSFSLYIMCTLSYNFRHSCTYNFQCCKDKGKIKDDMKRFTITDPPFWIALHNPAFDKMRWVSIKDHGEYYERGVTDIFHSILSTYELTKEPTVPLVIGELIDS